MSGFAFSLEAKDGAARAGKIITPHGEAQTPLFMPVGTYGALKGVAPSWLAKTGSRVLLGNAYHLALRPGAEKIAALGGLHAFTGWGGAMLTDSGGYQIFSLGGLRQIDDDGVSFRSHFDGSQLRLTPETSLAIQQQIGADIMMVLDECIGFPASYEEAQAAMERSLAWAARAREAFAKSKNSQALFGIIQGGEYEALRTASTKQTTALDFDGYALGGLGLGEGAMRMAATLSHCLPHLPQDKPRYLMGIGAPLDMLAAIEQGVDMFDCVIPSREGRHGRAYSDAGIINLANSRFADDPAPLDPESPEADIATRPRAWFHHLLRVRDPLAASLLSWHNINWFQRLMNRAREAILVGQFADFADSIRQSFTPPTKDN